MKNRGNTNLIVILVIFVIGALFYLYYPEQIEYRNPKVENEKILSNTETMPNSALEKQGTATSTGHASTSTQPI